MPLPLLSVLASALPFGPPVDSDTLSLIAGNGVSVTSIATSAEIPGMALVHGAETPAAGTTGLAAGGDHSSISVLLRIGGIHLDGRRIAGPLNIALQTSGSVSLWDLGAALRGKDSR
jgi:hypothetical protein